MSHPNLAVVTGAFGYTGRFVARGLLDRGVRVRTLTRRQDRANAFGGRVDAAPLDFSDPDGLCRSLEGAGVLYNTYWVRFARGQTTFDLAVENSTALFEAAAKAGVGRIVHFSVTNAASDSRLPYFRGKGQVEESLKRVGVPTPSSGRPWSLGKATSWSTTSPGRCAAFRSSRSMAAATIPCNPCMPETSRNRPWKQAPSVGTPCRTPPGRTRCRSRRCCACWHPRWAPAAGWFTRPRLSASP